MKQFKKLSGRPFHKNPRDNPKCTHPRPLPLCIAASLFLCLNTDALSAATYREKTKYDTTKPDGTKQETLYDFGQAVTPAEQYGDKNLAGQGSQGQDIQPGQTNQAQGQTGQSSQGNQAQSQTEQSSQDGQSQGQTGQGTTDGQSQAQTGQGTTDGQSQAQTGQGTTDGQSQAQTGQNTMDGQAQGQDTTDGQSQSQAPDQTGQNTTDGQTGQNSQAQGQTGQNTTDGQEPSGQEPQGNPSGQDGQEPDSSGQQDTQKEETVQVNASISHQENKKNAYISWERTEGAASYKVQRSDKQDGKFSNIAALGSSSRKYTDTNVKRGSKYFYRIAAKMKNGKTLYSNVLSFECPLSTVSGVRLVRYSTSSIKVLWNKSKDANAEYYKVYYSKTKSGKFKHIGTTKNTWYRAKNLDNYQNYYFQVKACASKKASGLDSAASKAANMITMPYSRTTIFAGDSLTTGLTSYHILDEIAIGGNKNVVAAVGLNTTTFRTKRVFSGKSGLDSIISSKPYRVYIMLGVNEIHYRSSDDVIAGYREILRGIQSGSPDTDIVVLAAAPVTSSEVSKRSGFAQIPAFNSKLKVLAEGMGARYFDYTGFLKDSVGCLSSQYAAGDGFHWQPAAYHLYAKQITAYDKSLD